MEWLALLLIFGVVSAISERKNSKKAQTVSRKIEDTKSTNQWDNTIEGTGLSINSSWGDLRTTVFKRDNYTCKACGRKDNLTVDHIVQLSCGGTNNLENLQTLCKYCHEEKDNRKIFNRSFNHDNYYGSHTTSDPKLLIIETAIKNGSKIKISYIDILQKTTYREISPTHFTKEHGIAYLVAFCHLRNAKRTFRVSRITII